MQTNPRLLFVGCLILTAACSGNPVGPLVPPGQQFTLAPGQSALVQGTVLRIEFLRVMNDSRCPADAVCIQGGDAVVFLRVGGAVSEEHDLHTGNPAGAVVTYAGWRIQMVQLQPYPFSARPIAPGDYRVTLVVTR